MFVIRVLSHLVRTVTRKEYEIDQTWIESYVQIFP